METTYNGESLGETGLRGVGKLLDRAIADGGADIFFSNSEDEYLAVSGGNDGLFCVSLQEPGRPGLYAVDPLNNSNELTEVLVGGLPDFRPRRQCLSKRATVEIVRAFLKTRTGHPGYQWVK